MKQRSSLMLAAFAVAASTSLVTSSAAIAGERHAQRYSHGSREAAPKDCTRYNARWGHYTNIWCTPAEQLAFDLWDAERARRRQQ